MNMVWDFHKGNAIRYKYLQEHLRKVDQQNKTYIRRKISPFLIQKEEYNTLDYHKPNKKGVKLVKTPNIAADEKEEGIIKYSTSLLSSVDWQPLFPRISEYFLT